MRCTPVRHSGRLCLLLLVVLAACDIEFVAIDTIPDELPGRVVVQSEHGDSLRVRLRFDLPTENHSVAVALDGEKLARRQRQEGRWRYDTTVVVNPDRPDMHLRIETNEVLEVLVPLLTRGAAAHWSAAGSLVIPLSFSEELIPAESTWEVHVADPVGRPLLNTEREDGPVPNPVILGAGVLPNGAAEVKVVTTSRQTIGGRRLHSLGASRGQIEVLTHSTARVPIPERGF